MREFYWIYERAIGEWIPAMKEENGLWYFIDLDNNNEISMIPDDRLGELFDIGPKLEVPRP